MTKKRIVYRNSVINNKKWYLTSDRKLIYTYFERTMANRDQKNELVLELQKRDISVAVFSRDLTRKNTGERMTSYIITTPTEKFFSIFSNVNAQTTKIASTDLVVQAVDA